MIRVVFVCLGNICRSPMAEAVLRKMVSDAGAEDKISVDSCGTSGWHTGEMPHRGTCEILKRKGVPFDGIYASALKKEHFDCDYIIAMDKDNLRDIKALMPRGKKTEIKLLSDYARGKWVSVPDPWYTGDFELTYKLVTEGCAGLMEQIAQSL